MQSLLLCKDGTLGNLKRWPSLRCQRYGLETTETKLTKDLKTDYRVEETSKTES